MCSEITELFLEFGIFSELPEVAGRFSVCGEHVYSDNLHVFKFSDHREDIGSLIEGRAGFFVVN
jgi:hypothetical protein